MEIKSLKGLKFKGENNTVCDFKGGYGLYIEGKGFISFIGLNEKNGVKTPYTNKKKVLQSIIDSGGLINFDNVEFLQIKLKA